MIPDVFLGTLFIFLLVVVLTRIFGLKSFSKMTGFDFVITVAIGNIIGMSINSSKPEILLGAFILLALFALNYAVTLLRFESKKAEDLIDNDPLLLMENGQILEENMKASKVTQAELQSKLREANVIRLSQVKAVILETTGEISVLHSNDQSITIEDYIMGDVIRQK
ncbi:MAG: YetF domain-containing protein [Bacteroidota bacterium]|nr:YetF domain-containing protein [Bacteroidota bacterium]MEE3224636.1 YetF domain-containing protein [Bacteroidota bacterium]